MSIYSSAFIVVVCILGLAQSQGPCNYTSPTGDYTLGWSVDGGDIVFNLETPVQDGTWTGVAFGDVMTDLDFIMIRSSTGGGQIQIDDATTDGYTPSAVKVDDNNGVQTVFAQVQNGILRATFRRSYIGGGANKNLGSCLTWQYPVSGGSINGASVGQHIDVPLKSATPVCPLSCGSPGGVGNTANLQPLATQPPMFPMPGQPGRPTVGGQPSILQNQLPPIGPNTNPFQQPQQPPQQIPQQPPQLPQQPPLVGVTLPPLQPLQSLPAATTPLPVQNLIGQPTGDCQGEENAMCAGAMQMYKKNNMACTKLLTMRTVCCQTFKSMCPGM